MDESLVALPNQIACNMNLNSLKILDILVAVFGLATMILLILIKESICTYILMGIAAILCIIYVGQFIHLWRYRRISFDRHLQYGNYVMKFICVSLLMPTFLAAILSVFSCTGMLDEKELVYAKELYECGDNELPCSVKQKQENPGLFWTVYYHYIDPGNQHMSTSKWGRITASIVALCGILLLNGLLVSSLVGCFDSRKERIKNGEVYYKRRHLGGRRHYVIIGGNNVVFGIVRQIMAQIRQEKGYGSLWNRIWGNRTYVLIQTTRDVESFRRELFTGLNKEEQKMVVIYYGSRTSETDLEKLVLENAKEVYVLGENVRNDDKESYHDTMNMMCIKHISELIKDVQCFYIDDESKEDYRLVCKAMFEYQATFNIIQTTDINDKKIKFSPFNYYEMWAQKVLVRQELMRRGMENEPEWVPLEGFESNYNVNVNSYLPLEGYDGIKSDDEKFVHLVIVGMSRMGVALAVEAAHLAHYPNFKEECKIRTRITFIDSSMEQEMNFFKGRFKEMFSLARQRYLNATADNIYADVDKYEWVSPLNEKKNACKYDSKTLGGDFVDIEWEFVNGSLESPYVQQYLVDAAANRNAKLTIAICLPENSRAIAAAAYISDEVYGSKSLLQVLVYQKLNNELVKQINLNARYNKRLKAFGMTGECYENSLERVVSVVGKYTGSAYSDCLAEQSVRMLYHCLKSEKGLDSKVIDEIYSTNIPKEGREDIIEGIKKQWEDAYENDKELKNRKELHKEIVERLKKNNVVTSEGKSTSAKMWSVHYNISTMWTKFRCITTADGKPFNPLAGDARIEGDVLQELAYVEHNRWCVEQLLLRYRPLSADEQRRCEIVTECSSKKEKERMKKMFAHLDICSNKRLREIDIKAPIYDLRLTEVLPEGYREYMNGK